MNSLFPLRYRHVLWGTAIAACLFSGFVVMLTKVPVRSPEAARGALSLRPAAVSHVAQGLHSNPAAFPAKSAERQPAIGFNQAWLSRLCRKSRRV